MRGAPAVYSDTTHGGVMATYQIASPVNVGATDKGIELGWQQTLWGPFGAVANCTFTDGRTKTGAQMVGNSKNTYNAEAYFDNGALSARLAYTDRSSFLVGLDSSFAQHEDGTGDLAASIDYKWNDHLTFTFDALNLNNPTLKYYGQDRTQMEALYSSGRQFYLGARPSL